MRGMGEVTVYWRAQPRRTDEGTAAGLRPTHFCEVPQSK
jgi:hypothetical protein